MTDRVEEASRFVFRYEDPGLAAKANTCSNMYTYMYMSLAGKNIIIDREREYLTRKPRVSGR